MGSGMPSGVRTGMNWVLGIGIIALILVVLLILFGNLSGNLGFAALSAGANNTNFVINNYTESAVNVAGQFPVIGTIIGIALLLVILIGLLIFMIRKLSGVTGGSSNDSFG